MRKKMIWKKIAAMAMTAIMAVSLTACGSDAGSSTGSDSGDKTLDVIAWSSLYRRSVSGNQKSNRHYTECNTI